ncbi:hypothetical protein LTR37_008397 [Vermiconidia calcicola]|uniref:Uncharacterized protein n=1 Tax=Vermiconidia calcicola TaxID=1690605 RepID=A0ACC3NBH8_9PEZI|nr:hypothetical protein LTR37_008397 [Vermiconidia calcicola]
MHFEHGGVDKKGFDMLYRMIEMMTGLGHEAYLVYSSKTQSDRSLANMEWYADCIVEGCEAFRKNMEAAALKASQAADSLPELKGEETSGDELQTKLTQWRWKLKTLHDPTGNDIRLFHLILKHYDENVYQRLEQYYTRIAVYGMESVLKKATNVYGAVQKLYQLAVEADMAVIAPKEQLQKAMHRVAHKAASLDAIRAADSKTSPYTISATGNQAAYTPKACSSTDESLEILTAAVYKPPTREQGGKPHPILSKSFSVAEEEVSRRRHARAATSSELECTIHPSSASLLQPKSATSLGTIGSRRKGIAVPRIFTGSFSQLESDIRKLQLEKVNTQNVPLTSDAVDKVKIRDFGATPAISPCSTPSPTPLLQRREAFVSKETEVQDRLINGEVIATRRPSTKGRAQTIDDRTGGLEAWLKEESAGSPTTPGSGATPFRGNLRHREHTL